MKLRLGRLTGGGQKGVDSRIVRDLITLSLERAITDAYLLGGDEDLREGVAEAQERGVHVALIGIEPLNEQNLSPTLAMDADQVVVLNREFLEPHFTLRQPDLIPFVEPHDPKDPDALGRSYALAYVEQNGNQVVAELSGARSIPPEIDRQLLFFGSRSIGTTILDDESRIGLRAGFRAAIQEMASSAAPGED